MLRSLFTEKTQGAFEFVAVLVRQIQIDQIRSDGVDLLSLFAQPGAQSRHRNRAVPLLVALRDWKRTLTVVGLTEPRK
jgi:hypothetical protein